MDVMLVWLLSLYIYYPLTFVNNAVDIINYHIHYFKVAPVLLCVGVFNEVKLDTTPCLHVKTFLLLLGHMT